MALSADQRERLLALINSDDELQDRLANQLEVTPNEDEALANILGRAHLSGESDPVSARLLAAHRVALAEPERPTPTRPPTVTIHSAKWLVEQIKPHLADEPELARALADKQRELEAAGQSRADAVAHVVRNLLAMAADSQPPLDGHSPLARAVRIAASQLQNGTWRTDPPSVDLLAVSADAFNAFDPWRRSEVLHDPAHVTRQPISGPPVAISRYEEPELQRPSVIVTGGTSEGGEAA